MNDEKTNKIMSSEKLDDVLPKYEPIKLSGKNLGQNYVSAFNTGMNIYQCVNYLQGNIDWTIKAVNDVVKSWNTEVSESIDQSKAIVRETTTEQFNTEWTNKQPELIEQVNTLTTNQFNEDWGVLENRINTTLETQNTNIQNIQNEQNELETNTNNNINAQNTNIQNIQNEQNELKTNTNNNINAQNTKINSIQTQQTTLSNRMDTFTSLSAGSTTGDAELQDIRVGANGVTYNNAGDAVRGQYSQLKEDLVDLTTNDITGSYTWKQGSFVGDYASTNGHYTNDDKRYLINSDFITNPYDIYIDSNVDSNVLYNVYLLNSDGVTRLHNHQSLLYANYDIYQNQNESYIIPRNTYYRIELYFKDKHTFQDSEIQTLLNSINIKSNLVFGINNNAMNLIRLSSENFNKSFQWKIGSFDARSTASNGLYTNDDKRFITMYTFYKLPFDIIIYNNKNSIYSLYELTKSGEKEFFENKTINGLNQRIMQTGVNTVKANTYFRLDVSYKDYRNVDNMNDLLNMIHITSDLYYNANIKENMRIIKTVGSRNCDFTSLITAIKYAVSKGNVTLELSNETFDISNEVDYVSDREGIKIGNGLILKGKANTEIICNYTGNVGTIQKDFSIFSAMPSDYTLENVTLKATNIRYCVHDECSGTTTPYEHKYINCNMYHDSSNAQWRTSQCIGGGFGTNATCIVDSCIFESVPQYESRTTDIGGPYLDELRADGFSWHSNNSNLDTCNKLIATNNYVKGELGTIRYASGNKGYNIISNNSFGKEPIAYDNTGETNKWNNEIRVS